MAKNKIMNVIGRVCFFLFVSLLKYFTRANYFMHVCIRCFVSRILLKKYWLSKRTNLHSLFEYHVNRERMRKRTKQRKETRHSQRWTSILVNHQILLKINLYPCTYSTFFIATFIHFIEKQCFFSTCAKSTFFICILFFFILSMRTFGNGCFIRGLNRLVSLGCSNFLSHLFFDVD